MIRSISACRSILVAASVHGRGKIQGWLVLADVLVEPGDGAEYGIIVRFFRSPNRHPRVADARIDVRFHGFPLLLERIGDPERFLGRDDPVLVSVEDEDGALDLVRELDGSRAVVAFVY